MSVQYSVGENEHGKKPKILYMTTDLAMDSIAKTKFSLSFSLVCVYLSYGILQY